MATPNEATAAAIRALFRGVASPDQQRNAMAWLVAVCGTMRPSMNDNPRTAAWNEGRRWVGLHFLAVGQVHLPLTQLSEQIEGEEH